MTFFFSYIYIPRAEALRQNFVVKMIPMLNPDGVAHGHYRTDTRGVNLNRMYLNPDQQLHPSVFGARSVVLHHHKRRVVEEEVKVECRMKEVALMGNCEPCGRAGRQERRGGSAQIQRRNDIHVHVGGRTRRQTYPIDHVQSFALSRALPIISAVNLPVQPSSAPVVLPVNTEKGNTDPQSTSPQPSTTSGTDQSGIAVYVDLHAHATKRGCFLYGNYLKEEEQQVQNMLYARLVALNSPHLDFEHCVFSEKNMYSTNKRDGLSKEGSGRVALHKATGIIHRCVPYNCNDCVHAVLHTMYSIPLMTLPP